MAASPARCPAGPSSDGQDTEVFSDDSGVDLRPQPKTVDSIGALNLSLPDHRRNKRKSSEPKRRKDVLQMKRFCWDTDEENEDEAAGSASEVDVFEEEGDRPSSGDSGCQVELLPRKKRSKKAVKSPSSSPCPLNFVKPSVPLTPRQSVIKKREESSAIIRPSTDSLTTQSEILLSTSADYESAGEGSSSDRQRPASRPRNYKSMSRQRRIEANARERTRVHTISAAFESLRRAVPAYAHNQKLSKLAILRIASAYIVALACLNDQDYSQEQNNPSLEDCVEQCTRTIQDEGRSRRRSKD